MHNPLGSTYDLATKTAIVKLAHQYNVYIIEDDYLADFDSSHSLPLHYLDTDNRVIYIKSFTPTLFPALRIGAISLPSQLRDAFIQHKSSIDYDTNLIMQKALSLYIDNGMFSRNTQHLFIKYITYSGIKRKNTFNQHSLSVPYRISKGSVTFQLEKGTVTPAIQQQIRMSHFFEGEKHDFLQLHYGRIFQRGWTCFSNDCNPDKWNKRIPFSFCAEGEFGYIMIIVE